MPLGQPSVFDRSGQLQAHHICVEKQTDFAMPDNFKQKMQQRFRIRMQPNVNVILKLPYDLC